MKQTPDESGYGSLDTDSIMAQGEAEANFFCWDKSNDDKEELMKGGEWEAEQVKQNQAGKAGKGKTTAGKEAAS
eukprot:6858109-Ditylum_brightwellii.AAC.1